MENNTNTNSYHKLIAPDEPLKPKTKKERKLAFLLIVATIVLGMLVAIIIAKSKNKVKTKIETKTSTLVNVSPISKTDADIIIETYGTLEPSQNLSLYPQVSGSISSINSKFIPGGLFKKGDVIATIDDYDYKIAVTQKEANLTTAQANFDIEKGEQEIAKQEWEIITTNIPKEQISEDEKYLALRKPQLKQAEASLDVAKSYLKQAKKNLQRTKIRAPFDSVIKTKNIDVGSFVTTQTSIADIIGVEEYWIVLSIPVDRLKWIDVKNSKVLLQTGSDTTEKKEQYRGKILKILPNLKDNSLTAQMLVAIRDPLFLKNKNKKKPLLVGSYMKATIIAKEIKDVFKIPITNLDNRNRIFIFGDDKKLIIRKPNFFWKDKEFAYAKEGLKNGEKLITTKLTSPITGMELEIEETLPLEQTQKQKKMN